MKSAINITYISNILFVLCMYKYTHITNRTREAGSVKCECGLSGFNTIDDYTQGFPAPHHCLKNGFTQSLLSDYLLLDDAMHG
jgi:hypothetical protein